MRAAFAQSSEIRTRSRRPPWAASRSRNEDSALSGFRSGKRAGLRSRPPGARLAKRDPGAALDAAPPPSGRTTGAPRFRTGDRRLEWTAALLILPSGPRLTRAVPAAFLPRWTSAGSSNRSDRTVRLTAAETSGCGAGRWRRPQPLRGVPGTRCRRAAEAAASLGSRSQEGSEVVRQ